MFAPFRLRGLTLKRGYRRSVLEILGGTQGCSHFLTLALDLSSDHLQAVQNEGAVFTPLVLVAMFPSLAAGHGNFRV